MGRLGQKAGKGYYRYAEGSRQAEHDVEVDALVLEISAKLGYQRRDIGAEEIVERCLLALVNEGAKILEENIAASSHDIDCVYLNGYGFPKAEGGPMQWADAQGMSSIRDRLQRLHSQFGEQWQPAGLITKLAETGQHFADVKEGRV
jgi:3-hydroxyacyl-CoA dehydrogenase